MPRVLEVDALNARWLAEIVCGERLRMNMDDSRIIARFQSLTTGFMAAKRLGQWRPDLADELYRTWVELEQRGLKKTPAVSDLPKETGRLWEPPCWVGPGLSDSQSHRLTLRMLPSSRSIVTVRQPPNLPRS